MASEQRRARQRALYAADPEKYRAKSRRHYHANVDDERAYNRTPARMAAVAARYRTRYKAWTPEQILARGRAWRAAHPDVKQAQDRARRVRRIGASGFHSTADWRAVLALHAGLCAYCGADAETQDHFVPLVAGGTHDIDNIVPACSRCNSSKGARPVVVFLAQRAG